MARRLCNILHLILIPMKQILHKSIWLEVNYPQKHLTHSELSTKAPDSSSELSPETQSQQQMTHIGQKTQNTKAQKNICLHLNWNHSSLKIKYENVYVHPKCACQSFCDVKCWEANIICVFTTGLALSQIKVDIKMEEKKEVEQVLRRWRLRLNFSSYLEPQLLAYSSLYWRNMLVIISQSPLTLTFRVPAVPRAGWTATP